MYISSCTYSPPTKEMIREDLSKNNSLFKIKLSKTYDVDLSREGHKCPQDCSSKINNVFTKVEEYYKLKNELFVVDINTYFAVSMPSKDLLVSDYFIKNEEREILTALMCHELSHISYGHSYQKSFSRNTSRKINARVRVSWQESFGVGIVAKNVIFKKLFPSYTPETSLKIKDKKDNTSNIYFRNGLKLSYLGGDLFPLSMEIQADDDALRCLQYNKVDKSYLRIMLMKLLKNEKNNISEKKVREVRLRIKRLE